MGNDSGEKSVETKGRDGGFFGWLGEMRKPSGALAAATMAVSALSFIAYAVQCGWAWRFGIHPMQVGFARGNPVYAIVLLAGFALMTGPTNLAAYRMVTSDPGRGFPW